MLGPSSYLGTTYCILELWVEKKKKARNVVPYFLDSGKAGFKRIRERVGRILWTKILLEKSAQEGWEEIDHAILKTQRETISMKRRRGYCLENTGWTGDSPTNLGV